MIPAPNRRWIRFSLRTLFVVVTVAGFLLGYELKWVRERRHEIVVGNVVAHRDATKARRAPWPLPIFGELGYESVILLIPNCHNITLADEQQAERIHRLFPEAQVIMQSGTLGEFLDETSPYHPLNRMQES